MGPLRCGVLLKRQRFSLGSKTRIASLGNVPGSKTLHSYSLNFRFNGSPPLPQPSAWLRACFGPWPRPVRRRAADSELVGYPLRATAFGPHCESYAQARLAPATASPSARRLRRYSSTWPCVIERILAAPECLTRRFR